jgi:uncharacterized protein YjiS (DUF1127 family)
MSTQHTAISGQPRRASGFADPTSPAGWIFSTFAKLHHKIATRFQVRRDIRELQYLSNASLRDIGIERSEIVPLVLREHYGLVDSRYVRF